MTFRDILEQNCVATDFLTSQINGLDAPGSKYKKDNASLNPERAFWNNDYQVPSDQKLNGLLAVMSEKDFADDFLMSRLLRQTKITDRSDVYFVYVPSYTAGPTSPGTCTGSRSARTAPRFGRPDCARSTTRASSASPGRSSPRGARTSPS